MGYTPHVLVVGGGATGTGVARDLAMRGLEVTLVDRGPLANGTSGSMHALLHSGARYAVDDPETAGLCLQENRILRDIADQLIDDAGGLFARLPADDADYFERKREACEAVGIPVETLDGDDALAREPALTEALESALAVPDAVIDPVGLCVANARSAVRHGATVRTGWQVVAIETEDGAVDAVRLVNEDPAFDPLDGRGSDLLHPDYVVNATGPWAGDVAEMASLDVPIRQSRGAMVTVAAPTPETVLNRCRPRTEGDIAVPFGDSTILGTTDRDVDRPGIWDRDPAEVDTLVDELADLVPEVATSSPVRAYWGVRALPAQDEGETTDVSRSYTLLDHEVRDDTWGMSTVFGGKLTIHRHIAEAVADHVCAKFGIRRDCATAEEPLPVVDVDASPLDRPDHRGHAQPGPDPVLCLDRGVPRRAVRAVVEDEEVPPGHDLRPLSSRTGAATGGCQGGRCGHRLAFELAAETDSSVAAQALDEFLADRWTGLRYVCWGDQLRTAAQTYRLHGETMHRDGQPGPTGDIDYGAFDDGPTIDRLDEPSGEAGSGSDA